MAKVFFNEGGVLVDDSRFMNQNGDQYPIRNITSVKVREKDDKWLLIVGLVLIISGLTKFDSSLEISVALVLVGALFFILWWFGRRYIIWIGTGGMDKPGIIVRKNKENLKFIIGISNAINESLSNLQKT